MTFDEENILKRQSAPHYENQKFVQDQFSILSERGQRNFYEVGRSLIPPKQDSITITREVCIVPTGMKVCFKRGIGHHSHELTGCGELKLISGEPFTLNVNEEITLDENQQVEISGPGINVGNRQNKFVTLKKGAILNLCEISPVSETENSQNEDDDGQ